MRQKCDKFKKNLFCATVCAPVLYALPYIIRLYNGQSSPLLWAGSGIQAQILTSLYAGLYIQAFLFPNLLGKGFPQKWGKRVSLK